MERRRPGHHPQRARGRRRRRRSGAGGCQLRGQRRRRGDGVVGRLDDVPHGGRFARAGHRQGRHCRARPSLRRGGAAGSLAAANSRANTRRLASAITPITLVIGSSGVLLFIQSTIADETKSDIRHGVVADYVVSAAGPGLPAGAERAGAHAFPASTPPLPCCARTCCTTRTATSRSPGRSPSPVIRADLDDVLDVGMTEGSLAELGDGTVALDQLLAGTWTLTWARRSICASATARGSRRGSSPSTSGGSASGRCSCPVDVLAPHVRAAYDSQVLVSVADGADAAAVEGGLRALGVARCHRRRSAWLRGARRRRSRGQRLGQPRDGPRCSADLPPWPPSTRS